MNKIVWLGLVTVAQFLSWLTPKNQAGLINKLRSEKIYNVIEKNDHSWKTITCTRSKNIKMKLYVQMLVNAECETHLLIPTRIFGFVLLLAFSRK